MPTPEEKARKNIDNLLKLAGWEIQDYHEINLGASLGVAVREFPLTKGFADYLLFLDRKAVGVVEAKAEGTTLSGVASQSDIYTTGLPENIPHIQIPLPFVYESTGVETYFRDLRDPDTRSRRVFAFHTPGILHEWTQQTYTLRNRLKQLPPLMTTGLRDCQIEAITNLEKSFADAKPRALIQMATGSGKTFTAVSSIYRLIKYANAKRALFLVDRNNLGRQTLREFQQYITPDDGRKFTELYNVQHLTTNTIDKVSRVCITTIQRLFSMLKGEVEYEPDNEEESIFHIAPADEQPKEITYNHQIPIDTFDFIVTDECHRSIYNLWRQVLEYFDAFIIGLTATPSKQTIGFFNQNLVMEYPHERAVADGVNVGYEVYRIKTKITEQGSKVDAGYYIDKRDKQTRQVQWEQLDEDLEYTAIQLDRAVVTPDQIRTVIRTFKTKLFTEIFPNRNDVPKTLIFAKDDSHAEDIVQIAREEFSKGNEFCKKITYKTTGEKPENILASFRNSYNPRIAVTVDMVATGTDIRPLECLLFMRDVKSRIYFDQMKGRGTRTLSSTDLKAVTPDVNHKTHFMIVDAVGVCESIKTDSGPMDRKRTVPFEKLLMEIAIGKRDEDTISSLAGRLSRLNSQVSEKDRDKIKQATSGTPLPKLINDLLDAIDLDKLVEKAKEIFSTDTPSEQQLSHAQEKLIDIACSPFDRHTVRDLLVDIRKQHEQIVDTVSQDDVTFAGYDEKAKEKARTVVDSFKLFIEENKDEITALQILYSRPYSQRHLTFEHIKELVEAMLKKPYFLTTEQVWLAYEQLEASRVKDNPKELLTNVISLIRFAIGKSDILESFSHTVDVRFEQWIEKQVKSGRTFTDEQLNWLRMIKNHIASSSSVDIEDFDYAPFFEKGGTVKATQVFGKELSTIISELNEVIVA